MGFNGEIDMKKKLILCTSLIITLWIGLGLIDFFRVKSFERPLFCIATETFDDGGSGHYIGLGYSFDIMGNFMPDDELPGVTEYKYYIFGFEINSGIRD